MSDKKFNIFCFFLIINFILLNNSFIEGKIDTNQQESEISQIFVKFEDGMNTGAVKEFSLYFDTKTYISLETGISSYFSKDQSYYIIKEFFSTYKPIRFKFIRINDSADTPFAVGQFTYSFQGMRRTSQVFVSLKQGGESWKISQITIN